jgi:hypothetical protein
MLCLLLISVCIQKKLLEKLVNNYRSYLNQGSRSEFMADIEFRLEKLTQRIACLDKQKIPISGGNADLMRNVEESDISSVWDISRHWRSL